MKTSLVEIIILSLICLSCSTKEKKELANFLNIAEPKEWILVIHPDGCKTCLESLYSELENLPSSSSGAIIVLAKNSKNLRLNPLFENSPIPLFLDEKKSLITHGFVKTEDQILVFRNEQVKKFDILNYQNAIAELSN